MSHNMLIFFDFDGTIVDITKRWWNLHLDLTEMYSLSHHSYDTYVQYKRDGIKEEKIMQEITEDTENIKKYCSERVRVIEDKKYLQYNTVFPGIREVLAVSKQKGRVVLITNRRSAENLHWELDRLSITDFFDIICPTLGQDKKSFLQNNFSGDDLKDALLISDGPDDYNTAQELGMTSYMVSYGCRNIEFLQNIGIEKLIVTPKQLLEEFKIN